MIHCTDVTARLLVEEQGISRDVVHAVPLDTPFTVAGVRCVALDANHCPGAAMFLFTVHYSGEARNILHTGDFRFHPRMAAYPALAETRVHTLFLDTTYSTPKWRFPEQDAAIAQMAKVMRARKADTPGARACSSRCVVRSLGQRAGED